jgi:hypothetical protein
MGHGGGLRRRAGLGAAHESERARGAALAGRDSEELRRTVKTGEQRKTARGRRKVEDDWTDLQFSKVAGTCL